MLWVFYLFATLFIILTYLLLAPFYLEIDSTKNLARIRFHHLANARLVVDDSLRINLKIFFFKKKIDLLEHNQLNSKNKKSDRIIKNTSPKIRLEKIKAIVKSFKINNCYIDINFADAAINGILYPVFYGIQLVTKKNITINFIGKQEVKLEIENNFARIIWAYINN
jgi:hypothetical protein